MVNKQSKKRHSVDVVTCASGLGFSHFFRYVFLILLTVLALSVGMQAHAEAPPSDDDTQQLIALLAKVSSIEAKFLQVVTNSRGGVQKSSGTLLAKRPNRFFWHSDPPIEQIISSDGEVVRIYDPDLEQLTIQGLNAAQQSSPAVLFSGDLQRIQRDFSVELMIDKRKEDILVFSLKPRNTDESLFESLDLFFVDGMPVEMRMEDGLGQTTKLSLRDVRINALLSDKDFRIDVPEGVDVISEGLVAPQGDGF